MTRRRAIEVIAHHEAGHIVAAMQMGVRVRFVGLERNLDYGYYRYGGFVITRSAFYGKDFEAMKSSPHPAPRLQYITDIERNVVVALSGREAQRRFAPRSLTHAQWLDDQEEWTEMLGYLISDASSAEFKTHLKLLRIRAARLIAENWPTVEAIAGALLQHVQLTRGQHLWRITGDELKRIVSTP